MPTDTYARTIKNLRPKRLTKDTRNRIQLPIAGLLKKILAAGTTVCYTQGVAEDP